MGYFPFQINLQLRCNKNCACPRAGSFCGFLKNGSIELSSKVLLYSIMFYSVELLVYNLQYVLLVDSIYIDVLVC